MNPPESQSQHLSLSEGLIAAATAVGLIVAILALDVDRGFRVWAVVLLAGSGLTLLVAVLKPKHFRRLLAASVVVAVLSVGVLAFGLLLTQPGGEGSATGTASSTLGTLQTTSPSDPASPSESTTPVNSQQVLSVAKAEAFAAQYDAPARIDVTLRNKGTSRAILTDVEVKILDFFYAPACSYGGDIPVSGKYDLRLPDKPAAGATLHKTLHQQIDPDGADRFILRLEAPPVREGNLSGPDSLAIFLYRVQVTLKQDDGRPAIDLGAFVIEGRNALWPNLYYKELNRDVTPADVEPDGMCSVGDKTCLKELAQCYNANHNRLKSILSDPVTLSEGALAASQALFG